MNEELGVIEEIHIGNRDVGRPVLWFTVATLGGASLQVLNWNEAGKLIEESGVDDFASIKGKPCVVATGNNTMTFLRLK